MLVMLNRCLLFIVYFLLFAIALHTGFIIMNQQQVFFIYLFYYINFISFSSLQLAVILLFI